MDHLPHPAKPWQPLRVPYLGGDEYDQGPFREYPQRKGWNIDDLAMDLVDDISREKAAAFLQSWLFFGLLHEVFAARGLAVKRVDFISDDSEVSMDEGNDLHGAATERLAAKDSPKLLITTRPLLNLLEAWQSREQAADEAEKAARGDIISSCLILADTLMARFATWEELGDVQPIISTEIEVSIKTLISTLGWSSTYIYGTKWKQHGRCRRLESKMRESGWCPSKVAAMGRRFDVPVLYYIYLLGPPLVPKSHQLCSRFQCLALNINESDYENPHCLPLCKCKYKKADTDKIASILASGGFPLVSMRVPHLNDTVELYMDLQLEIVEFRPGMQYVAVSHVWSDGLGNPSENAILTCQCYILRQRVIDTMRQVGASSDRVHLWMDTLCVPVEPQSLRTLALRTMRTIYEKASLVLVLDAEIMQMSEDVPKVEQLMRIATSNWAARLWTYQEGVLTNKIFLQLAEGPRSITNSLGHPTLSLEAVQIIPMTAVVSFSRLVSPRSGGNANWLFEVAEALQQRSTSKIRDEAVCLATLLGIGLNEVIDAPDDSKMTAFFLALESCPSTIIFMAGPRIPQPGFRWAPATLMVSRNHDEHLHCLYPRSGHIGHISKSGLAVQFPGFMISPSAKPIGPSFVWHDKRHDLDFFVFSMAYSPDPVLEMDFGTQASSGLAVIFPDLDDGYSEHGILVSDCEDRAGVIFATFVRRVAVKLLDPDMDGHAPEGPIMHAAVENLRADAGPLQTSLSGKYVGADQKWCIG